MTLGIASKTSAQTPTPVQIENAKPGTSDWRLTNSAYATAVIEAYPSATSVNRGGQIKLFVSTSDPTYTLEIFRMGWYQGLRGRRMTNPVTLAGIRQVIPTPDPTTGLIECNWVTPYVLNIPNSADATDWMSGFYYVKLTGSSGKQQYAHFVVRDDARRSDVLMVESITTAQAYNPWGGKSLYGTLANRADSANKAMKVSFDRPFYGDETYGAGNFGENNDDKTEEWGMVGFLESNGYDVTYATSVDLDLDPNLLLSHKAYLSVGHDEYWSTRMRNNVENAIASGVNVGFFSGNTTYWQVYFENSTTLNVPGRVVVGYKEFCQSDPITPNNLKTCRYRDAPVNRPEDSLKGNMYITQGRMPFVVEDASHWVFTGTGLKNGDQITNPDGSFFVGYEIDAVGAHSPGNVQRVAHSLASPGNVNYADTTVYRAPSGATVFSTGSIFWTTSVQAINQMTKNVLARLISGAFADTTPSRPQLPQPFQSTDIGPVGRAGFVSQAATDSFTLNGDGQDSFSGRDAGFLAYQPWNGDGQITLRLTSLQQGWDSRAGVMIRETLDPASKYASIVGRPSGSCRCGNPNAVNEGAEFKVKTATGGSPSKPAQNDFALPNWYKLVRIGDVFYSFTSPDGVNWSALGSTTVAMNRSVYIGAWVASAEHNVWKTANFDHVVVNSDTTLPGSTVDTTSPSVSMTAPANGAHVSGNVSVTATAADNVGVAGVQFTLDGAPLGAEDTTSPYSVSWDTTLAADGIHTIAAVARDAAGNTASDSIAVTVSNTVATSLPSGWSHRDIGAVGPSGSSSYSNGTFTVKGAGADIWNSADAFQYAYTTLSGDGRIIARVNSVSTEAAWVKVGVMMRETLDPTSKQGFMLVSNAKGLAFQRRTATLGISTSTAGGAVAAPRWVRLDRTGSKVDAYQSADGVNWVFVDTDTIPMVPNIYVGLAVSSHTTAAVATGVADNVAITTTAPPPDTTAPTVSISSPSNGATASGVATVIVAAADDVGVAVVQLLVDGVLLSGGDTSAPYSFNLDTTSLSNGAHSIAAVARDAAGNTATSTAVTVIVNNVISPGACTSVTVSPSTQYSGAGAPGTVAATWTVLAAASSATCTFQARTDALWLELRDPSIANSVYQSLTDVTFTGNAQIKVHTLANTTGAKRVAHVLSGGVVVVTITQE